jgi:3-hydroxyisobutyrate dehydrogenase-like beta-hydroxyacid dehydrogenase
MADFSVGIVGLDWLGAALTGRLEESGISYTATDLDGRRLQAHVAGGGSGPAGSPFDLAQVCDLILLAETSEDTAREAVLGPVGLIHALRPGTIVVDMSDASPQSGPALAGALSAKGAIWIEATPVGNAADARAGKLTLLTAGPKDAIERVAPVLAAIATKTLRLGEIGSGPLAKALARASAILSLAAFTEMLVVAKSSRLDPAGLLAGLSLLAPGIGEPPAALATQVLSGRYESEGSSKRIAEDIALVLDAARAASAPAPLLSLLQSAVAAAGHSGRATGSELDVARWTADNAGVEFAPKPPPT